MHSLSDVMQTEKGKSSKWVSESNYLKTRFEWQDGFAAFTYSQGQVDKVYRYLENRQAHHEKITFLEEYRIMLDKYNVEYGEKYHFKEPE
jgi:elongation factor P--beta-lysine ligase